MTLSDYLLNIRFPNNVSCHGHCHMDLRTPLPHLPEFGANNVRRTVSTICLEELTKYHPLAGLKELSFLFLIFLLFIVFNKACSFRNFIVIHAFGQRQN